MKNRLTDQEVIELLTGDSAINHARRQFSSYSGKIDQAGRQRKPLSPIEMRRMEFEAVEKIIEAYLRESNNATQPKLG
jgi:hypothetical protein